MKTLMKSRRGESVFIISIAICLSVLCQSRLKAATEVSPRGVSQSHARLEPIESWLDERVESIEFGLWTNPAPISEMICAIKCIKALAFSRFLVS